MLLNRPTAEVHNGDHTVHLRLFFAKEFLQRKDQRLDKLLEAEHILVPAAGKEQEDPGAVRIGGIENGRKSLRENMAQLRKAQTVEEIPVVFLEFDVRAEQHEGAFLVELTCSEEA